jgi:hypothetical protein
MAMPMLTAMPLRERLSKGIPISATTKAINGNENFLDHGQYHLP